MIIFIVAVSAGAIASFTTQFFHVASSPNTAAMSYADFLSITLTALSLMITVLGFFVAAAGVIGWSTLETKLREHSVDYFAKQLEKDGPLRRELEQLFTDIAYSGVEGLKESPKEEGPYSD